MAFFKSENIKYFNITLCLLSSVMLQGCRFGNKVDIKNEDPGSTADGYRGFYETSPSTYELCAGSCTAINTNKISDLVSQTMSNPLILFFGDENQKSGEALLANYFGDKDTALYVSVDNQQKITMQYGGNISWGTSECTLTEGINGSGSFNFNEAGKINSIINESIKGHLEIRYEYSAQIKDSSALHDCAPTLELVEQCYINASNCGQSTNQENLEVQAEFARFYAPYINAGLMNAADISTKKVFTWTAVYK